MKRYLHYKLAVIALLALLAILPRLAAQDNRGDYHKHRHYKVIDMGTLGGPSSYFNSLSLGDSWSFGTAFYGFAQVRNRRGILVGFADTSTPDPYLAFCYTPDCFVSHAFQWQLGVKIDLGALPGGSSSAAFDTHALLLIPSDDDHLFIEGCDYSPVEAAEFQSSTPAVLNGAASVTSRSRLREGRA
jgi:hypothetical protein